MAYHDYWMHHCSEYNKLGVVRLSTGFINTMAHHKILDYVHYGIHITQVRRVLAGKGTVWRDITDMHTYSRLIEQETN